MTEDPRVERSRRVIRQAAIAELGEVGYGPFSIESVAARARVGKSTIYRYWPGKLALIADALETLNEQPGPVVGEERPRERVETLLRHLCEVVADSPFSSCIPALIDAAERDPTVRDFHHRYNAKRRQALVRAISDGIDTGDFSADLDPELAALALAGAIFYRRVMTAEPFNPTRIPELIETVLAPPRSDA